MTWQYYYPDGKLMGEVESDFTVYPEWYNSWRYHGYGWNDPGHWPIGTYTVKILVDGAYAGEKQFSIYGDTSSTVSTQNNSVYLYNAVLDNDTNTVRDLLSKGADPNTTNDFGVTVLNVAASNGNIEIAKMLLDKGADIDGADVVLGWRPLMSAAEAGQDEMVKFLLGRGAPIDGEDSVGYTALIYTASAGHTETAKLLIDAGADVNHISGGYSPLISAAKESHPQTVMVLLENNADPDARMESGETPLMLAVQKGDPEIAKALLDYGADVSIRDNKGRTALEWAEFEQHKDIGKLIKEAEKANINGNWEGIWTNPRGYIYLFNVNLNVKDPKNVKAAINWTLNASPSAAEQANIGRQAIEYVKGNYDPNKRTLYLEGYDEKDKDDVIGLDKYKLVVSLDGSTLKGKTENHGDWQGKFSANRKLGLMQRLIKKAKQKWGSGK
jgi:ankyrin repeat protein